LGAERAGGHRMSIPYFPMYPDDFEADTAHLSLAEDGAYNRLLRLSWRTPGCKLPDDDAWIMRKMRAGSDDDKAIVAVILAEFFTRKGGKVYSERLLSEYVKAHDAHSRRVLAGSKGGSAKALKTKETGSSNATAKPKQPEPEPEPLKREPKGSPKKRGSRLPDDWVLPKAWGEWAVTEGFSEMAIRDQAARFRDYWIAVPGQRGSKLDWLATWRNWMRDKPKLKAINGGQHEPASKSETRLNAFVSGARGAS
jgi:uncharacterized protein YdaU (DUF1376 family)